MDATSINKLARVINPPSPRAGYIVGGIFKGMNLSRILIAIALIPLFAICYFLGDAWFEHHAAIYRADATHGCMLDADDKWVSVVPDSNQWFCPYFWSKHPDAKRPAAAAPARVQPASSERVGFDQMLKNLETNRR